MSKRDEYVEKLKIQLDAWNAEVTKWEARTKAAQANMRTEYEKQLAAFHQQRDQATKQLQQVQSAAGDAWMELSRGADQAWANLRAAFEKAQSHFKK